jgi:hypothetical protein
METDWDVMRDSAMARAGVDGVRLLVDESMATADVTLDKAEKFMRLCLERARQAAEEEIGVKEDTPPADTPLGTTGKHDRLDNTLRPN